MKNAVILILSVLVIGLGSYLIFDKVINKKESKTIDNNSTVASNNYAYDKIAGKYVLENSDVSNLSSILYLKNNGMFVYDQGNDYSHAGRIGNYIINDDKVYLNYLFAFGGDIELSVIKGSKVINIESVDVLVDNVSDNFGPGGDFTGKLIRKEKNDFEIEHYEKMLDLSWWLITNDYKNNN